MNIPSEQTILKMWNLCSSLSIINPSHEDEIMFHVAQAQIIMKDITKELKEERKKMREQDIIKSYKEYIKNGMTDKMNIIQYLLNDWYGIHLEVKEIYSIDNVLSIINKYVDDTYEDTVIDKEGLKWIKKIRY